MLIFHAKCRPDWHSRRWLVLFAAAALAVGGCGDKTTRAYAEGEKARALMEAGDLPGARAAIGRALALRGDQVDLLLLDGRIRYQTGDYGGAFDSYNMALAIDPNSPEALQAVSQIGASLGRERESTDATDKILASDPSNAAALMVMGVRQLGRRDFAAVKATGDRILAGDPRSEPGLVLKARGLSMGGERAEALALLRDGQQRLGNTQMIATALLEVARDQGDADLMINQYRALAELAPKNADLSLDEANVQYKRGRQAEARARGWAVLTENGGNADAVQRLNDLWSEYDKTPLTPGQIETLGRDGAPAARLMAARYYMLSGDTKAAETLVGALPGDDAAGLRARIAYLASSGTTAAPAEEVLARDNTNCDALTVRAADALRRGKPTDTVIAAQVIASECPEQDGSDLIARAYRAKGDDAGTRRAYLDGIRARPLATAPVERYAAWLLSTGAGDQAVGVTRRLTQRAPAKISGWRLLNAVCSRAAQPACVAEARDGEAAARRSFLIDLPPGQRRSNPLLGNSWR